MVRGGVWSQKGYGPGGYGRSAIPLDTCKNITFPQLRLRAVIKRDFSIRDYFQNHTGVLGLVLKRI